MDLVTSPRLEGKLMAEPNKKDAVKGDAVKGEPETSSQGSRTRSPAYPGINLETAIKRAREVHEQDKMNIVPLAIAVKRWGFKEKSSGGLVTVAALKSFGLIKDSGSGKDRKIQLTEDARRILLDARQDSQDRDMLIKQAALNPKIHNLLWKKWGLELPSDETLKHALTFDYFFNENSVTDFIKEYKDTILFAKLIESDTIKDKEKVKIGDNVQWESQGANQFNEPKRVIRLSDDGAYAFIEDSNTGIPVDQLSIADVSEKDRGNGATGGKFTPPKHLLQKPGMNNEVFTLDEGEVTLQWPQKMSLESYEDFKAWLELIAKKAKRSADKKAPPTD